ncbi:MAG TPA: hypothetical protein VHZ02_05465 [Acidimicrobiales bacterium]|jgi:hypothetical protein|nr:hypothetical protein [Acidimicrobiales bacterium]
MQRRTYLPLLLMAAPGALALGIVTPASAASGNGVANQSASQIVTAASAATGAAKSFTYGGTTQQSGTTTRLSVSVSSSGKGQGTITISGQPVRLIKIGNTVYFSSNKAFWDKAAGSGAGSLFGTRWVAVPSTDSDFAGINTLLDESQVASQFSNTSNTTFTKGKTSTINGQPVIAVIGKDTTDSTGGTVFVATTGKPYIIRVAGGGSSLTFTNYNKSVNPSVPPNSINISTLGGSTTTTG